MRLILKFAERIMRSREPDVVIGTYDYPYVLRWYLIPRNNVLSIYLHLFLRGDEDDALHDHMGDNLSWLLETGYEEEFAGGVRVKRLPGSFSARRAETPHRIHLFPKWWCDHEYNENRAATTIFITGRRRREWGFHCPYGWTHWKKIVGTGHYGARPGCAAYDPTKGTQTTKGTA